MKKMIFVGGVEKGYFCEELAKELEMELVYINTNINIKNHTNKILNETSCSVVVYDIGQYANEPGVIVEEIDRIFKVNNAKVIIYAEGYLPSADLIVQLHNRNFMNFIFSSNLSGKKDQLEKAINGYYEANGMEVFQQFEIQNNTEKETNEIIASANSKTIAIAGTMGRIGTTTQAVQIVKYLMLNGYKVAYIEMNDSKYVENLAEYFESDVDDELGRVTFENTDLFFKSNQNSEINISEILKLKYDFYIYDFGVFDDTDFNKVWYLEKDIKVVVCGTKANEIKRTTDIISNTFYSDVNYIFSFVPDGDKKEIFELMDEKKDKSFLANYTPDPFVFGNGDIYQKILNVENISPVVPKKKFFFGHRKK